MTCEEKSRHTYITCSDMQLMERGSGYGWDSGLANGWPMHVT